MEVPHHLGVEGHSDGDPLLHALIDALLGAAALGDIGAHFPPSDPRFKDAASTELLRATVRLLETGGWKPVNVDATIAAERPKLAPHIPAMRQIAADILGLDLDCVSIKATTTDGLGFIGRQEGIAAMAVALIERRA